jgi:uncharacterized membrane protein YgcG
MTSSDRELDKVLSGKGTPTDETGPLVDVARRLEGKFDVGAPRADSQKALFAAAVGTRRRPTVWRYIAPAIAVTSLLAAVFFAGRAATPGHALYPVRKALQQVDLAPQVGDQIDRLLTEARLRVVQAEARIENAPSRSVDLATAALKDLGHLEALIADLPSDQRQGPSTEAAALEDRALAALLAAFEEDEPEDLKDAVDDLRDRQDSDDDNSGSGSDDSSGSGSDDSSGSGSDEDNSGPGGGSDDSSGSGSGSDDSSGPGSGDDD